MTSHDVIVVGGGPVGVCVGLFCARRGMTVAVIERDTEVVNTARAVGMDDEVQRIFQNEGLIDEIREITTAVPGAEFVDVDGNRLVGVDLPEGTVTALGHPPIVMYHQPDLEALLRRAAVDAGVDLMLGHAVTGFEVADECGDGGGDEGGESGGDVRVDEGDDVGGDEVADEGGDVRDDDARGDKTVDEGGDERVDEGGDVRSDEGGDVRGDAGTAGIRGESSADAGADGGAPATGDDPVSGDVDDPVSGDVDALVRGSVDDPVSGDVDAAVSVAVREIDTGITRTMTGEWLIGADGASSFVRKSLGLRFDDLGFDQDWLVVDTELLRDVDLPLVTRQICDPERPATFVPGFDRRRRWEFQLQPGESRDDMVRPDVVWDLLSPWIQPGDASIERAVVYRFHATVASSMRAGRVLLAGDAAHQMPPFLGQGLCSGIRDALNLAWRLEMVADGRSGERLLDAYADERRTHVTALTAHAVDTGRLIDQLAGRVDAGVGTESGYGGGRSFPFLTTGQLAGSHPLVGRQLPQPMIDGAPLDHLLGPGWSIVSADGAAVSGDARERWVELGARFVHLGDRYSDIAAAPVGGALIVRPDRYVAAVVDPARVDPVDLAAGSFDGLSAELFTWFD